MAAACMASSCNTLTLEDSGNSVITLAISNPEFTGRKNGDATFQNTSQGLVTELDTNQFTLSIYSENGVKVYDGKYGAKPDEFVVIPGSYDIKLYSGKFNAPSFNKPLYGDEQTILAGNDMRLDVLLSCRQINGGLRINFESSFKNHFKGNGLKIRDSNGEIEYPYTSKDYCYVSPGAIELYYTKNLTDTLLCTRQVGAGEMLTLNLSYMLGNRNASNVKIEIDTTREWRTDYFNVGYKIPTGAYTIEEAKGMAGEKSITVFGFILGGDASETTMRIAPPFSSKTNIVIASSMLERNRNNCMVVELPTGSVREGLNLVNNPGYLGSAVIVTGNIVESYYGYTGIKNTKAYTVLY